MAPTILWIIANLILNHIVVFIVKLYLFLRSAVVCYDVSSVITHISSDAAYYILEDPLAEI